MAVRFLRYLRSGAATAIVQRDGAAGATARPVFSVGADILRDGAPWQRISPTLSLFGPADVLALEPGQVLRSVPDPGAVAADPGDYPFVEFARPDLPWLFTPLAPTTIDTLTPWLCLVVVELTGGVSLAPGPHGQVLTITAPATIAELPDLAQAHAWAHVQLDQATAGDDLAALVKDRPQQLRSRLIGARQLQGARRYTACLVPTYLGGVQSGLDFPVNPDTALLPAWIATTPLPLALPVFHQWDFTTSDAPSFESLVRRLKPRADLGRGVGTRELEVTDPVAATLALDGALQVTGAGHMAAPAAIRTAILGRMELPGVVSLPRYGRWHAAAPPLGQPGAPAWLDELNCDPVRRVAAGLGTAVVQEHQEELMATAWEQAGEILRVNQLLRAATLALTAAAPMHTRRLIPLLADASGLLVAAPAAHRLRVDTFRTVRGAVRTSCLPGEALTGAFRRISRPGGPLGRRLHTATDVPLRPGRLVAQLAGGELRYAPPVLGPGAVTRTSAQLRRLPRATPALVARLAPVLATVASLASRATAPECTPLDLGAVTAAIRRETDPARAIPARVGARLDLPAGTDAPVAGVGRVLVAPHIPAPMYRPLVELTTDWLLPGLGTIPPESMAAVEPNHAFIESYFVGLNHEMGRELLWRGFPTDQRGTVFDRFWDEARADITPHHTWQGALGTHALPGRAAVMVLVLRGELVRRFPAARVFLQRARATRTGRTPEALIGGPATELPVFDGRVGPDLRFIGFAIGADTARGRTAQSPQGYYVTFQQEPGALAFGPATPTTPGGYSPPTGASDATATAAVRRPVRLFIHANALVP